MFFLKRIFIIGALFLGLFLPICVLAKSDVPIVKLGDVADLANTSNASTYGPTTADDSLWHIASDLKTKMAVSMPQLLLAILTNNPQAFVCHNINSMKTGVTLKLPSLTEVQEFSPKAARSEVNRQDQVWENTQGKACSIKIIKKTKTKPKAKTVSRIKSNKSTASVPKNSLVDNSLILRELASMQARLDTMSLSAQSFQQGVETKFSVADKQFTDLLTSNKVLKNEVDAFSKQIGDLNQEVASLKTEQQKLQNELNQSVNIFIGAYLQKIKNNFGVFGFAAIGFALLACLVLLLWIIKKIFCCSHKKLAPAKEVGSCCSVKNKVAMEPEYDLTSSDQKTVEKIAQAEEAKEKEDYDFLSGEAGIAAKLDLARVYIDMGEKDKAKTVLNEVLANGNAMQQKQAKDLLQKIT